MSADKKKEDEKPKTPDAAPGAEGAEGQEGEAAAPKGKKKLVIIIIAVLFLIGAVVGGLFAAGILGGSKPAVTKSVDAENSEDGEHADAGESHDEEDEAEEGHGKKGKKGGKPAPRKPVFFDLPDIIVNLNSPTPRPHFINLKLTLEVVGQSNVKKIEDQMPRVIDSFNGYLREIRKEDLQGSAGMYRLENELMLRLEKLFGKGVVIDILFREIIIQ